MLLGEGFRPVRTVYLAYGHDEEVGGLAGAREIAALLKARGVELEMVLDEGGVIGDGYLARHLRADRLCGDRGEGLRDDRAECASRRRTLVPAPSTECNWDPERGSGQAGDHPDGRATRGPDTPAIRPDRSSVSDDAAGRFRESLVDCPACTTHARKEPHDQRDGANDHGADDPPSRNQRQRASQLCESGHQLPDSARRHRGDCRRACEACGRRHRVEIKIVGRFSTEPSAVSSTDSESFRTLERTIRSVAPDAIVAPYLVVVVTDARHYRGLSRNVFRFLPLRFNPRDLERIHGTDERIGIREYETAIRTYRQLVVEAAGS